MITGLDHVVIAGRDLAASVAAYETLLGRACAERTARDDVSSALFVLDNIAVELMAPDGDSADAQRLRAALETGEGLKSLVFATAQIERLHRRCERVGLAPAPMVSRKYGRSFRTNTERTHGVRLFFMQRNETSPASLPREAPVLGLDHVVIRTRAPERAAALYGARLGLDMRLDRELMGRRLMFFRCGDAIVEIADVAEAEQDDLWGLSWRVRDAEAARARLAAAGLDVSEVRAGMKPGTRVFTVRDGTRGVPTLMLEAARESG